jgi:CobQ-like glutamine amidotransferase family enzyme
MYFDIMNLYGEYGNIKILEEHIKDQGYEVTVDKKTINDEIDISQYSFIYIGCGTEKNQLVVLEDMKKYKEELNKFINQGKVLLATGNAYEIFGKQITLEKRDNIGKEDVTVEGLGIVDFDVIRQKDRITSDIIYSSKYLDNKVVGFINKMSEINHNLNPLFKVEFGVGENNKNDFEGVKYKNFFGTYVIGPILVRNPEFLNKIVEQICMSIDDKFVLKDVEYELETKAYELVLNELSKR